MVSDLTERLLAVWTNDNCNVEAVDEIERLSAERSRIEAIVDRAASDRSYSGDLIDDIRDIMEGKLPAVSGKQSKYAGPLSDAEKIANTLSDLQDAEAADSRQPSWAYAVDGAYFCKSCDTEIHGMSEHPPHDCADSRRELVHCGCDKFFESDHGVCLNCGKEIPDDQKQKECRACIGFDGEHTCKEWDEFQEMKRAEKGQPE